MKKQEVPEYEIKQIALTDLLPNKRNVRGDADKNDLAGLAESIKAVGLINPITVRRAPWWEPKSDKTFYEIVSGERRFKAAGLAGLETISAIIKELTDNETMEIIIIENLQRKEVHPLDEAEGFQYLFKSGKYNEAAIGDRVGKPATYVTRRLKLVTLTDEVKKQFREDKITLGHALEFARLTEPQQSKMIKWMEQNAYAHPTAPRLKEAIQQAFHLKLNKAVFDVDDDMLLAEDPKYAGVLSCKACPKRTGFNRNLFDDIEDDVCTDPQCYDTKVNAHIEKIRQAYGEKGTTLLSYSNANRKPKDGVFNEQTCTLIGKGVKKCKNTEQAVVTKLGTYNYGFNHQVGDIIKICIDPECEVHKRSSGSSSGSSSRVESAEEKKEAAKLRFDRLVDTQTKVKAITVLMSKIKIPLDNEIVERIASGLLDWGGYNDCLEELLSESGESIENSELHTYFKNKSYDVRLKFIAELVLRNDYKFAEKFIKKHKIDVAKIKKEVRSELKKQGKEEGKTEE